MTTLINNQKSTVLQLPSYSRYPNVNKQSNNAEWEVSIATQNIAINEGDSVVVKNVFLDTRNIGSNIISIEDDFEIEMDFYFYIMLPPDMYSDNTYNVVAGTLSEFKQNGALTEYGINMTSSTPNQPIAIELPLVLQYHNSVSNRVELVTNKFRKLFPKGNYSPQELSLTMNKLFSSLPDILIQGNINDVTTSINSGVAFMNSTYGLLNIPDYTNYNPQQDKNIPINLTNENEKAFFCEFLKDVQFPTNFNTIGATFTDPLCINCFQQNSADSPLACYADSVGTNQFSIIFDPEANIFKFDYTHMPIQVPIDRVVTQGSNSNSTVLFGAPVESVLLCATTNTIGTDGFNNMCKYSKHSGLIFKSLKPVSFFKDVLGFDVDSLVVNDNDFFNRTITYEKFKKITTDALTSTSMLFDSSTPHFEPSALTAPLGSYLYKNLTTPPLDGQTAQPYISGGSGIYSNLSLGQIVGACEPPDSLPFMQFPFSSIGQRTINAVTVPTSELETGHYLIEISGYQSEFISPSELMNIKAIVSSYYQSQSSFVTAPFSDSYTYVHTSPVPLVLSNLKIRVLNPITLKPVTGLGTNNAVYLQINRNLQPTQVD
jgi:hypothetical protein